MNINFMRKRCVLELNQDFEFLFDKMETHTMIAEKRLYSRHKNPKINLELDIPDKFLFDLIENGSVRKPDSMFMEARKP